MLLEGQKDREKRFKAMLQYLILREACKFDDRFPRNDSSAEVKEDLEAQSKEEDKFKKESAEKILREMELKFYDFFVEDLIINPVIDKEFNNGKFSHVFKVKTDAIKSLLKENISFQITKIQTIETNLKETTEAGTLGINNATTGFQQNKIELKKIFLSPIIENSIMTCDLPIDTTDTFLTSSNNATRSYLISDIDNVFQFGISNPKDNTLVQIRQEFLAETDNECCKIQETFTAIQANINTVTGIGCGLLLLFGLTLENKTFKKILSKQGLKREEKNSSETPGSSVRGDRITKILAPPLQTQEYV